MISGPVDRLDLARERQRQRAQAVLLVLPGNHGAGLVRDDHAVAGQEGGCPDRVFVGAAVDVRAGHRADLQRAGGVPAGEEVRGDRAVDRARVHGVGPAVADVA